MVSALAKTSAGTASRAAAPSATPRGARFEQGFGFEPDRLFRQVGDAEAVARAPGAVRPRVVGHAGGVVLGGVVERRAQAERAVVDDLVPIGVMACRIEQPRATRPDRIHGAEPRREDAGAPEVTCDARAQRAQVLEAGVVETALALGGRRAEREKPDDNR